MSKTIGLNDIGREPFRVFFPWGVLAGIIGVSLWPLYFSKVILLYPGLSHARIMAYGLFGGFIFGFLGTAMPRMFSTFPFNRIEVGILFTSYAAMAVCYAFGRILNGDCLFLLVMLIFVICVLRRFPGR